jgi:hypothetical protein
MDTRGQIIHAEYFGQTTLSPIGAAILLPLLTAVLSMSRRSAVAAFVAAVCFISDGQRISIAGLDFTPIRILIAVGAVRVLVRSEYSQLRWQTIDWLFACYAVWGYAAYALQYEFEFAALVRRAGEMYTYAGSYFLCRCWLRNSEDVIALGRVFAILAIPSALFFAAEWATGRNIFSIFGGVSEWTNIRDGRLRCQGPFPHAILAGCFWAGTCPLMASLLWRTGATRLIGIAGIAASMLIIVACASSTPILALAAMCGAASLFALRKQVRLIQITVLVGLIAIHFARAKPVWHLLGRINVLGSSTGHHRYLLIDHAIQNFREWCLLGVKSTGHWGPQMFDVTNQYLLEGVRGGFITMLLFIAILFVAFRKIGRSVEAGRQRTTMMQAWFVGAALFGHASIFFSVSYFGQVPVIFWLTVASAVAASSSASVSRSVAVPRFWVAYPAALAGIPNARFVPALSTGAVAGFPALQQSRSLRWSK